MEKLSEILEKSLKRLDLAGRLTEHGVWPIWNETVGPTIARNAQPEKIRNGTLFVKVTSSTWMQQLQYMKEMIADKLNQRMGKEVVKNIFFVVGRVNYEEAQTTVQPSTPQPPSHPITELDDKDLSSIHDPTLRQSLQRLYRVVSRRRRP